MDFIFHDQNGGEIRVTDRAWFIRLVGEGRIKADTLLFDPQTSIWKRAWELSEYHEAMANINPGQAGYAATPYYGAQGSNAWQAPGQAAAQEQPQRPWALGLSLSMIFVGLALVFFTIFKYSTSAYAAGYRMGSLMGGSLVIGLVSLLIWIFALKRAKGMGLLMFAGGFILLAVIQSAVAFREGQRDRRAMADMTTTMQQMMNGDQLSAKDSTDPMVKIVTDYAKDVQNDMMAMNKEMEALELDKMLQREVLQDSAHINGGMKKLQSMREMLDRYEAKLKQRADDVPNRVAASNMDDTQKREFIAGFNTTKDQGIRNLGDFFNIERSLASKIEEIFNFMQSKQGRYKFVGDQVLFSAQRDVAAYNDYLSDINDIVRQETDWRMRAQSQTQQQMDKMQRMMKGR